MKDNTILITGGGSGIGRALAEALHRAGNRVVIAGRRQGSLDDTTRANAGMASTVLDIESPDGIARFAEAAVAAHPSLNVVIHNAGIMRPERIRDGGVADAESIIATNLLGPIRLTAALLPHLLRQKRAAIVTVSSGLAFIPLASAPTYCATKAAIHSYTQSLRYQLKDTAVEVLEVIPPYVQTELGGPEQAKDARAMPLADFISETLDILRTQPDAREICVENVKKLRWAETSGDYNQFFKKFNDEMAID